jgi:hypothetical protein
MLWTLFLGLVAALLRTGKYPRQSVAANRWMLLTNKQNSRRS